MHKLTQEQITAVDKALWDIGIRFLDIRIEMTDHAATAIEGMEGSFEPNLLKYIRDNKQELKKNYSQFRANASVKAVKLLLSNMVTFRFVLILASVYAFTFAIYKYEGLEQTSNLFIILSAFAIPLGWMYITYISFTKQRRLFSTAYRLLNNFSGAAFLLCFPLRDMIYKMEISDAAKLLFYSFVISFYVMIMLTYRFLTKFYKSRYQVA